MEATIKHVQEIGTTLGRISASITTLEKDSIFLTDSLITNEQNLQSNINHATDDIEVIKTKVEDIKIDLRNAKISLNALLEELRDTARQGELDRIAQRIETMNPESFITKYELDRTLER